MVSKGFVGLCRSSVRALLGSLLAGFKFSLSLWIITCIVITCIGSIHRSQRERESDPECSYRGFRGVYRFRAEA